MGNFKLGDFGVARILEKTTSGMSQKGSVDYMAPELFKGKATNPNLDIYSLGIVMYKFLNGNLGPFRTNNTTTDEEQAFRKRISNEAPIPTPANADDKLARIVLKACSYRPEDRYQHPSQMRRELAALLKTSNAPAPGKIPAVDGNMPEIESSGTLDKAKEMFPPAFDSGSDTQPEKKKQSTPASGKIPAVDGDMPDSTTSGTVGKAMQMFPPAFDSEPDTPPEKKPDLPPEPEKKQNRPEPTKEMPEQPAKPSKQMEAFQLRISDEGAKKTPSGDRMKMLDLIPAKIRGKWEFADKHSTVVIPCIYESYEGFDSFLDGGDIALMKKNGSRGAFNKSGDIVILFQYEDSKNFTDGVVQMKKDGKWGAVNKKNETVIAFRYDEIGDGFDIYFGAKLNGKWGVIDKQGNTVLDFVYECRKIIPSVYGRFEIVNTDGSSYFVNEYGNIIDDLPFIGS